MINIIKKYWYILIIPILMIMMFVVINSDDEYYDNHVIEEVSNEDNNTYEDTYYYVDIKGEIKSPGVYKVSNNKRLIDVIEMAGGLTKNADTSILNLSKKVTDEMSIRIYSKEEIKNAREIVLKRIEPETIEIIKEVEKEVIKEVEKDCNCEVCTNNDNIIIDNSEELNDIEDEVKLLNINTATKEELMNLSGIGESKAIKIIEYRESNKFKSIEEIMNVPGIGSSIFEKIKEFITI